DMGPEGGSGGGLIVAEGTPEEVALVENSHTGGFLKPLLDLAPARRRAAKRPPRKATAAATMPAKTKSVPAKGTARAAKRAPGKPTAKSA
ncbi:MAG: excinuclease subunit, partial [Pseudonocardiales bacterium]|nr:excinuclease subunit [Pseudonocardiales bacterium]